MNERIVDIDLSDATSYRSFPIPSPTVLFLKPKHLESTVTSIAKEASKSWMLYPFARRHKLAGLKEGYITNDSLWDRLVYDDARIKVIGEGAGTVRGAIISGGPLNSALLTPSRIALSVPLINSYTHPLAAGPVMASHPLDLQDFPALGNTVAHVGPPSVNTEVKLVGLDDEAVEAGGDPSGMLLIRGPSVGKVLGNAWNNGNNGSGSDSESFVQIPTDDEQQGWVATGVRAKVQTNGAFQILP